MERLQLLPGEVSDLEQILDEAPLRWFRASEIVKILSDYGKFVITTVAPVRPPPSGSLFLFDRGVLRSFRKDGHKWRKKKGSSTLKEGSDKLKVNGVNALQCYYGYGEDNVNFHRRIYWMLAKLPKDIVLVHYREVNEGHNMGLPNVGDPKSQHGIPKSSSSSWSEQPQCLISGPTIVDGSKCGSYTELGNKSSGDLGAACDVPPIQGSTDRSYTLNDLSTEVGGYAEWWHDTSNLSAQHGIPESSSSSWSEQPQCLISGPTIVDGSKCGSYTELGNKSSGDLGAACDVPPIQGSTDRSYTLNDLSTEVGGYAEWWHDTSNLSVPTELAAAIMGVENTLNDENTLIKLGEDTGANGAVDQY